MRYTVYRIIVCSRTKIRMISSLRNLCVRILDADPFTIVVFQILDIKSNYLPGIVHVWFAAGRHPHQRTVTAQYRQRWIPPDNPHTRLMDTRYSAHFILASSG
jgi:hypothetical protein